MPLNYIETKWSGSALLRWLTQSFMNDRNKNRKDKLKKREEIAILTMYKWQIMLLYCISYIGFGKNLLFVITKAFLGPPQHITSSTVWKMMKYGLSLIRNFLYLDKIFPYSKYGKIRIRFCLYTGKYGLEKARIWAYFTQWSSLWH